jgi:hypothetical protein
MPDFTGIMTVATHGFINLIVQTFGRACSAYGRNPAPGCGFGIGKVVTANAGIEPFHTVEDQTVNRVAGGKRQATETL